MKDKLYILLILLIACNLRAPITGVGSLIHVLQNALELSPTMAGLLTTLPLLAFAAISPLVSRLARKLGAGNLLMISLLVLNGGILLRSLGGTTGLFLGTAVIGLGIGIGNVLLPALIKVQFPHKIPFMTSLYTATMQAVSAISTALSLPLASLWGWKGGLLIWVITGIGAFLCSLPQRRMSIASDVSTRTDSAKGDLYRKPLAWWITAYMGVQSMLFYSMIAWLSPIMQDKGCNGTEAGTVLSLYVVLGIVGSCMLPLMMARNKTQSATGIQLGVLYLLGMLLMTFASQSLLLLAGVLLCGFCSGGCISFSMALFGLHTQDGETASRISGLAQSIGYLIAAVGPVLLGKLYQVTEGWTIPLIILVIAAVFLIVAGKIVGKDQILSF